VRAIGLNQKPAVGQLALRLLMARFSFVTAGESHGPGLTAIVAGMPAGLELDREGLDRDMARRQLGHGRGGRMKIETDRVEIRSGLRHGRTLGSPIAVLVANRDYSNWDVRMNPWPVEDPDGKIVPVHLPRPGHADLPGVLKYGHDDVRNVLERASARETAARVAAGALARQFLAALGVEIRSHVTRIASVSAPAPGQLALADFDGVDESPVRCLDRDAEEAMVEEINRLRKQNESLGGTFEVRAWGLLPGLGSHVSWEERLDGRIAQAMCSIQSIKGVSIGPAWDVAQSPGSEAHDEIFHSPERGFFRETNRAGGLEGGMTNGEQLVAQVAIKPISTLTKPLRSVDVHSKEPQAAHKERTDSTVVPAAAVVGEAMLALTLARAYREKFGGDHIDDVRAALDAYAERIGWRPPAG
jgi:chorismate synthase